MTPEQAARIAKALESIAESLAIMAHPLVSYVAAARTSIDDTPLPRHPNPWDGRVE